MADIVVTASEVLDAADTIAIYGHGGVVITAGQLVYLDSSDGLYKLADTDDSVLTAAVVGVAMNSVLASGQPVEVAVGGTIDPGFTVIVGQIYVVSGTPGSMQLDSDLATLDFTSIVGIGITASSLKLLMDVGGVVIP